MPSLFPLPLFARLASDMLLLALAAACGRIRRLKATLNPNPVQVQAHERFFALKVPHFDCLPQAELTVSSFG